MFQQPCFREFRLLPELEGRTPQAEFSVRSLELRFQPCGLGGAESGELPSLCWCGHRCWPCHCWRGLPLHEEREARSKWRKPFKIPESCSGSQLTKQEKRAGQLASNLPWGHNRGESDAHEKNLSTVPSFLDKSASGEDSGCMVTSQCGQWWRFRCQHAAWGRLLGSVLML